MQINQVIIAALIKRRVNVQQRRDKVNSSLYKVKFVKLHLNQPCSKPFPLLFPSNRSGYQMFSQELLTNGELNHFSLKERMVEIGKRWHKLSQSQKDKYKKLVEEQQVEYKAELEAWVKVSCRHGNNRGLENSISSLKGNLITYFSFIYRPLRNCRE